MTYVSFSTVLIYHVVDTWEWNYIGESGLEILPRNSHSLVVLHHQDIAVLLLFGGANPNVGPIPDVFYAVLPKEVDLSDSFSVEWCKYTEETAPIAREMHGTCCHSNMMIISGGRSMDGAMLNDVWACILHCIEGTSWHDGLHLKQH